MLAYHDTGLGDRLTCLWSLIGDLSLCSSISGRARGAAVNVCGICQSPTHTAPKCSADGVPWISYALRAAADLRRVDCDY